MPLSPRMRHYAKSERRDPDEIGALEQTFVAGIALDVLPESDRRAVRSAVEQTPAAAADPSAALYRDNAKP